MLFRALKTVPVVCFWCCEATGEEAEISAFAAADTAYLDYGPCPHCAATFAAGIVIVEMAPAAELGAAPVSNGAAPTGNWLVIPESALPGVVDGDLDAIRDAGFVLVRQDSFERIMEASLAPANQ